MRRPEGMSPVAGESVTLLSRRPLARCLRLGWVASLMVSLSCGVQANEAVLRMLSLELAGRTTAYEAALQRCAEQAKAARPPHAEELASLGLARTKLLSAVGYLSQRNRYACEKPAAMEWLFAATRLERAQSDYGQPAAVLTQLLAELLQPGPGYFELALAFGELPEARRRQLQALFGEAPFDLNAAVRAGLP